MNLKQIPIEQLIIVINRELEQGLSVNKTCDKLGIKKTTLRDHMGRAGYTYNKELHRYIEMNTEPLESLTESLEEVAKPMKSMSPLKGDNKGVELINLKNNNDFIEVIKRLELLESKMLNGCVMGDTDKEGLKTYVSSNKVIKKSIFLYPEVWDKIDEVTKLFPQSTKQSTINSLLVEVLDKYLDMFKVEQSRQE